MIRNRINPIQILDQLYQIHETAMAQFPVACKEKMR